MVACYACARYRADLWGIAACLAMLTSAFPRYFCLESTNDITDVVFVGALLVPPFVFGRVARTLDAQARLLEEQQDRPPASRRSAPSATGSPASCTT